MPRLPMRGDQRPGDRGAGRRPLPGLQLLRPQEGLRGGPEGADVHLPPLQVPGSLLQALESRQGPAEGAGEAGRRGHEGPNSLSAGLRYSVIPSEW